MSVVDHSGLVAVLEGGAEAADEDGEGEALGQVLESLSEGGQVRAVSPLQRGDAAPGYGVHGQEGLEGLEAPPDLTLARHGFVVDARDQVGIRVMLLLRRLCSFLIRCRMFSSRIFPVGLLLVLLLGLPLLLLLLPLLLALAPIPVLLRQVSCLAFLSLHISSFLCGILEDCSILFKFRNIIRILFLHYVYCRASYSFIQKYIDYIL